MLQAPVGWPGTIKFPSGMDLEEGGTARASAKRRKRRVRIFWGEGMIAGVVGNGRGVG